MEAQRIYQRRGAMDKMFKSKVRDPRADEPIDEGWRPFDQARDWADPALNDDRWPLNNEALYYWRPTYWNGDQHKLQLPPRESTNVDRFLDHLRLEVPELNTAFEASERRWGAAAAFDICGAAADLVLEAYQQGDEQRALRVVEALLPAMEEGSTMYAPNCVTIGFLEDEGWHEPLIQGRIDSWPSPIREELREQQAHMRRGKEAAVQWEHHWRDLHRTALGQPIETVLERLRTFDDYDHPEAELGRQMTARVLSDPRWLYRHPVDSLRLAWTYRAVRRPWQTIIWLRRPRFAG